MKKTLLILGVLITSFIINGCQQFLYTPSYYVSIYNNNHDKYLTSFYFKSYNYGDGRWSKDQIYYDLNPHETYDLLLDQGTYDFEIVLEDDDYSYKLYEDGVYINEDTVLDICYDCMNDTQKSRVEKTKKVKSVY